MIHLKIILYGILAFIERNPLFCIMLVLLAIFAPVVFKFVGWIILGIIAAILIGIALFALRMRKMKRNMEDQFRQATGSNTGFGGAGFSGFGNMGSANGMTLEELVRQMQAQADARKNGAQRDNIKQPKNNINDNSSKSGDKPGDYVDFEEVK